MKKKDDREILTSALRKASLINSSGKTAVIRAVYLCVDSLIFGARQYRIDTGQQSVSKAADYYSSLLTCPEKTNASNESEIRFCVLAVSMLHKCYAGI